MDCFHVHILGCGSALPTKRHYPTAQIVHLRGKLFMIDCGEGTQLQFRQTGLNYNRIGDIFISHLHGDHCFGLLGIISTMGLLGRNAPLRIHARPELEGLMQPQLDYFCRDLPFQVEFVSFDPGSHSLVYEDRSLEVYCFPLRHRVKSAGFLFREKPRQRHMIKEMIDFYGIPLKEIPAIKGGADFVDSEGRLIANDRLTRPPKAALSYAFCSDTAYDENIVKYVKGVNLLYHEATFGDDLEELAESTTHSTASQAARIAQKAGVGKLIIGHYSARYADEEILLQQAQAIFPNTELADEGKCFDVAALRETNE